MVTVAEFYAPSGPVDAALLFPGEQRAATDQRVAAYLANGNAIANGYALATPEQRDTIARTYVMWRVYDAVLDRVANTPSTFSAADEGSVTFSAAQVKLAERRRDDALSDYNAIVSTVSSAGVSVTVEHPTCSIPVILRA